MRIVHVIYDSLNNPWLNGGGAHRTFELYKRLSAKHDVLVLTGNYPGAVKQLQNIRFQRIGIPFSYVGSRLSFLLLILFHLIPLKADIFVEDLGFPFPLLISKFKKRVIASVQFVPNNSYIVKRKFIGKLVNFLFGPLLKSYKYFITVSQFGKDFIRKYNNEAHITIIPNGIHRVSRHVTNNCTGYLLYVGRIDIVSKGLDILLEALKILKLEGMDLDLRIAGSGEKSEIIRLRHLIALYDLQTNVKILGYVVGRRKNDLIANSSIVVMPSRNEVFGIVALESLSHGKPLIAASVGGLKDIIEESKGGILFRSGNAKELASKISYLSLNKKALYELGKNGVHYSSKFLWDDIALEYEKLLLKTAKSFNG